MKTFVTIFVKQKEQINQKLLLEFMQGVVGYNLKVVEKNNLSFVFDEISDINFEEVSLAINYELLLSAKLFKARTFELENDLYEYLDMIDKIDVSNLKELTIDEAYLIVNHLGDRDIIKKAIFGKYYDTRLEEEIKCYLDLDMNISKASDYLYLHRNTLMNKIDKFIEISGYDIKKFKDAFVIYHLL